VKLIVTEKDSAARKIAEILGGKVTVKEHGRGRTKVRSYPFALDDGDAVAIGLRGHVMETVFPTTYRRWSLKRLGEMIEKPDLAWVVDGGAAGTLAALRTVAKGATELVIATEELPRHPGYFYCRAGHPLAAEKALTMERILAFPFAGTRMPRRVAERFLQIARAGAIDPDSGDYLPPIKVDSIRVAKDVVMQSDAVGAAPLSMIAPEVRSGHLVALPLRLPWMSTGYGFVYLRDRMLSPAAEAFMAEVRSVEAEQVAQSQALTASSEPRRSRRARRT
jgi:DNA-binding transcriptional LysR family regulator